MKTLREILKSIPIGTKLWCDICGEVELVDIRKACYAYPIVVKYQNSKFQFDENGGYDISSFIPNPLCVLWPNKDTRTWDNYQLPVRRELSKPAIISIGLKMFLKTNTDYYTYTKSNHVNTVLKWLREIYGIYVGVEIIKEVSPSEEGIQEVNIFYKPYAYSEIKDERRVFGFSTDRWVRAGEVGIIESIKYFMK